MNVVLIGNGPSALNRQLGREIDSFDKVVRFNNFIQIGYEDFIGARTDVHAVNEGLYYGGIRNRGLPILMAVPWTKPTRPCLWQQMHWNMPYDWDLITEQAARAAMDAPLNGRQWLSTGMLTVLHYFLTGASVSVVGFDCFSADKHHYAGDAKFCGNHDSHCESEILEVMTASGSVAVL